MATGWQTGPDNIGYIIYVVFFSFTSGTVNSIGSNEMEKKYESVQNETMDDYCCLQLVGCLTFRANLVRSFRLWFFVRHKYFGLAQADLFRCRNSRWKSLRWKCSIFISQFTNDFLRWNGMNDFYLSDISWSATNFVVRNVKQNPMSCSSNIPKLSHSTQARQ